MTLLLLEFSIRLFFPQPINHYNFTLIYSSLSALYTSWREPLSCLFCRVIRRYDTTLTKEMP
jgi:hypothetical protein